MVVAENRDLPAAHHAGASKLCIVDRVGLDVTVSVSEVNPEDSQVVDMVQVFADALLCVTVGIDTLENEVTSRSTVELPDCMASQGELAFIPLDVDTLILDVEVMFARVIEKVTSVSGVKEGHRTSAIVGT